MRKNDRTSDRNPSHSVPTHPFRKKSVCMYEKWKLLKSGSFHTFSFANRGSKNCATSVKILKRLKRYKGGYAFWEATTEKLKRRAKKKTGCLCRAQIRILHGKTANASGIHSPSDSERRTTRHPLSVCNLPGDFYRSHIPQENRSRPRRTGRFFLSMISTIVVEWYLTEGYDDIQGTWQNSPLKGT